MYAICYACDNNYALQVGVSLLSLLKMNTLDCNAKIYVFIDNVQQENKDKLLKIAKDYHAILEFIDAQIIIEKIKKMDFVSNVDNASLSTFVRLFIKDYIPSAYKSVIYIDADTLIIDDIKELFEAEYDTPVTAAIDIMPTRYKKILKLDDSYYFNCGILHINLDRWKELKCEEKILEHIKYHYNKYLFADQDVINIVLKNHIGILPLKYNVFPFYGELDYKMLLKYIGTDNMYYSLKDYETAKQKPAIIHLVYSVVDRPWFNKNMNRYGKLWDAYVAQSPWKTIKKRSRKFYSKTRLLQIIYKAFGAKPVLLIQKIMNNKKFNTVHKQYIKDQSNRYKIDK